MKSYYRQAQIFGSIFILLAGLAWIWFSRSIGYAQQTSHLTAPQEGFLAPDFSLSDTNNNEFTLSTYLGKPVIFNFWASWCPPCRAEMPAFQQAHKEFQSSDLVILGINATNQDQLAEVSRFVANNNLTFPILFDQTGSISHSYNIYSLPTTYFIDRSGIIQKVIIGGPIPIALLRVQIGELIEE